LTAAAADAILVVHAAFVVFVVGGLPAIWIGVTLGRPFAFNPWFRGLHLAAIAFVVAETLLGYMCPLTVWEDALRARRASRASSSVGFTRGSSGARPPGCSRRPTSASD
jgi:polyferredoxin